MCKPGEQRIGLEVETLFVDRRTKEPITREQSQGIMKRLAESRHFRRCGIGTTTVEKFGDTITAVKNGVVQVFYELGWNNFELTYNPYWLTDFPLMFSALPDMLECLYIAALYEDAEPVKDSYDGFEDLDTLMMPDERDQAWKDLDGPVLCVLGHIASVHYNIGLTSIDEGMRWISKINELRGRHGWPSAAATHIWGRYLAESRAGYQSDRFGSTPTTNFDEYCRRLSEYKIVMNRIDGVPYRIVEPKSFAETPDIDIELFLRSVWWGARLRVRDHELVLEIRDVPRGDDESMQTNFDVLWTHILRSALMPVWAAAQAEADARKPNMPSGSTSPGWSTWHRFDEGDSGT